MANEILIDTHCHFNHSKLSEEVEACLERAEASGVERMIVVGYDLESSEQAVILAETFPLRLYAAVGIHPHDAKDWNHEAADRLKRWSDHPGVVAVGEIGLDFHYDFSPRPMQYEAFQAQMEIAREAGLPVIIHCREAYPETLGALAEAGVKETGGVMHCWAGSITEADQTVSIGLALGFGGTLTFKNAEEVRMAAQNVPLESLLVETDAPYLAPMPHRGKRNEPAFTRLIAQRLAELRGMTFSEIAQLTTANAQRVFPRLG